LKNYKRRSKNTSLPRLERLREELSGRTGARHKSCSIEKLVPTTASGICMKAQRKRRRKIQSFLKMTPNSKLWKEILIREQRAAKLIKLLLKH